MKYNNISKNDEVLNEFGKVMKSFGINTMEDFDNIDEELGCELYECIKAEIIEKYDVNINELEVLTLELFSR